MFLVVNSASWASVTVANHFIALRDVPPINILYLNWTGGFESVDSDTFRTQILGPTISAMKLRGIFGQIDYVVYSSDFPYVVNLTKDFEGRFKLPPQATPACSLNSATYLWHLVSIKVPTTLDPSANQYMRSFLNLQQKLDRKTAAPTHGFRGWYGWGKDGALLEAGGQPYLLSTMLGVTSGRGTSVGEAVRYLSRSAKADGTAPPGTIYFTRTDDVRSKSRQDEVEGAMQALSQLGVQAKVVGTPMPVGAPNVAGLMAGVSDFSWPATRSTILPGAICDNFTSFGGIMTEGSSQTPLTEFLRYGAAGSAGTVVEPFAIPQKFASPNIFVHYARGCTLAESYYQSLFAPAQVLIVGDPLCRPWANIPQLRVSGVEAGATVSGTIELVPEARLPRGGEVDQFELFVDGRRSGRAAAGQPLSWDSRLECDGYHELRVVGIAAGPIETQGRTSIPVIVQNDNRAATMTTTPEKSVRWNESLAVDVHAAGSKQIYVLNNGRLLGTIAGEQGQLKVDPRVLGLGPVDLQAIATWGTGPRERVVPPPVQLIVESAPPQPALPQPAGGLLPGMILRLASGRDVPVQETRDPAWLSTDGVEPNQQFIFQAYFRADQDEVYQFQLWHYGSLQLAVDRQTLYNGREGHYEQHFVPVALAKGLHRLTVQGRAGSEVKLRILFGGPGATSLDGQRFQHPKR